MLLYERRRLRIFENDSNMSGIVPTILAFEARKVTSEVDSARPIGNVHGRRLWLSLIVNDCKFLNPERNEGGMELKLLLSK